MVHGLTIGGTVNTPLNGSCRGGGKPSICVPFFCKKSVAI